MLGVDCYIYKILGWLLFPYSTSSLSYYQFLWEEIKIDKQKEGKKIYSKFLVSFGVRELSGKSQNL